MDANDVLGVGNELPIACSLSAAELRDRGEENLALFRQARRVRELADGYAFAFVGADKEVEQLLRFVLAERACCPFWSFDLTFTSPHQEVWVAIRGNAEAKALVREGLVAPLTSSEATAPGA
ncbi:MAG TPA: hypothetical protein VGR57_18515 [Ktedonobacterales bacterium]|nr:hypothetical protein [Ktedonobacterales bacterium]